MSPPWSWSSRWSTGTVQVTVAEAKAQLSSLLDAAEGGDAGVMTHCGKPIAELVLPCNVRDLLPQLAALPRQQASGVEAMRLLRGESRA